MDLSFAKVKTKKALLTHKIEQRKGIYLQIYLALVNIYIYISICS